MCGTRGSLCGQSVFTHSGIQQNVEKLPRFPTSKQDALEQELYVADRLLKAERKSRLQELFDQERLQYEEELNHMGLALVKHRY